MTPPDAETGVLSSLYFPYFRGLAHELNNPLTGILGYAQLLGLGPPGEGFAEELKEIEDCAVRCRDLVALMSRCSKPEEKDGPFDPRQVFDDLVHLVEPLAHRRGIQVEVARAEGLPHLQGRAWRTRAALLGLAGYGLQAQEGSGYLGLRLSSGPRVEMTMEGVTIPQLREALESVEAPDPARMAAPGSARRALEALGARVEVEERSGRACLVVALG